MLPKVIVSALSLSALSSAYVVDVFAATDCQGTYQSVNVWDNTCANASSALSPVIWCRY
jgi:hypothetical protein